MSWIDNYKGSGLWDFTAQPQKASYNEGDKIATAVNPVWSSDHSGIPITDGHNPCGYWFKDYSPPVIVYYTSKLYPIVIIEDIESYPATILFGELRALRHTYEYIEELESYSATVTTGELRALLKYYTDGEIEELESYSATIQSGELRALLNYYTDGEIEELESYSATIQSGSLEDVLIHYENGVIEELESYSATITGGTLE